jgi:hypothetical protein
MISFDSIATRQRNMATTLIPMLTYNSNLDPSTTRHWRQPRRQPRRQHQRHPQHNTTINAFTPTRRTRFNSIQSNPTANTLSPIPRRLEGKQDISEMQQSKLSPAATHALDRREQEEAKNKQPREESSALYTRGSAVSFRETNFCQRGVFRPNKVLQGSDEAAKQRSRAKKCSTETRGLGVAKRSGSPGWL